ncbi:MAG: glucan ABC transporter ATP-binding protein/ permease [Rhodobacteraceae bacterium]|nr:glucan ABC transporter ATP-binding protein/ permease [Paracoccaceae bacterium]
MSALTLYRRALALLYAQPGALWLTLAGVALAVVRLAEPILFGRVIDALSQGTDAYRVIGLWALFGLAGIAASALTAVAADRLAHRARLGAMAQALASALALPPAWHAERGTGAVLRSITAGAGALFGLWLGMLREHLASVVSLVLLIPAAIGMDVRMGAILILLGAVYLVLNTLVIRRTRAGQRAVETEAGRLHGRVGDVIGNVTVVQSYGRIGSELAALDGVMRDYLTAQTPVLTWWGLLSVLTRAAATLAMVAIFSVGAWLSARGEITLGEIVAFGAFAGMVIGQLDRLSGFVSGVVREAAVLGDYFELVDAGAADPDLPGARPLPAPLKGEVRFEGVSFRYPGAAQGVEALDFAVAAGQTVALVGATGSGKSTTLALLQRLRRPDAGRITIDGHDISDITAASLRGAQAVVFQEAGLLNRSIAENIALGRIDASEAEIEAAALRAEAHDFIVEKPGGYGFRIGERGASLSGGERQRIALARAILKDAPLLLLDEATSALDPATEARIKRAVEVLRKGRTTFVIAHRLSTIAHADQILVFERGRIVERGRYAELLARGGRFAEMVRAGELPPETEAA